MNRSVDHLVAGLVAAVLTGVVAAVVIWQITATQHDFVATQFAAQNAKLQAVGAELANTASDLKRLDGALKATNATLVQVKDQVSLVGTRTGIARLNNLVEAANKTLADIKQATAPEQAKAALAPLAAKLDDVEKALAALQTKPDDKTRDQTLARVETALAGVKAAIAKQPTDPALTQANAKLDAAAKSLATIRASLDMIKSRADARAATLADASKALAALDTSVKQGFTDVATKQTELTKAVAKPAPAPQQPTKPKQDLVVFYVEMAGAAPAPAAAAGLTPATPPPLAVHYEDIGGVDDDGQAVLIADKLKAIVKGHSGCTIAVAGHADTLGGDRANYALSKQRATEVADKLKTAFAGEPITITRTQWGERRLKEWTPDDTAREANRRVDIKVSCEK